MTDDRAAWHMSCNIFCVSSPYKLCSVVCVTKLLRPSKPKNIVILAVYLNSYNAELYIRQYLKTYSIVFRCPLLYLKPEVSLVLVFDRTLMFLYFNLPYNMSLSGLLVTCWCTLGPFSWRSFF